MTTIALVIMCLSIGSIVSLIGFCLFRVMTSPLADDL